MHTDNRKAYRAERTKQAVPQENSKKEKSCGTFCIKEDWTTMLSGAILTLQTNI